MKASKVLNTVKQHAIWFHGIYTGLNLIRLQANLKTSYHYSSFTEILTNCAMAKIIQKSENYKSVIIKILNG